MAVPRLHKAEIAAMVERIVDHFHPERIILFGSYAHGDARRDSDVDLLVVLDIAGQQRRAAAAIDVLLADRTLPLDVIVVTPAQFRRQQNVTGTVVYPAVHEGRVMYERAA